MFKTIRKYILIAAAIYAVYFFLDNHIIIDGKNFYLLKKGELTFTYTFYNLKDKKPDTIMKIDDLRYDGIGDLLVELGKISEREQIRLENKYDVED